MGVGHLLLSGQRMVAAHKYVNGLTSGDASTRNSI